MNRPDDIPQDIWDDAESACDQFGHTTVWHESWQEPVARAILAERERCLRLAHQEKKRHEGNDKACVACLEIAIAIIDGREPAK